MVERTKELHSKESNQSDFTSVRGSANQLTVMFVRSRFTMFFVVLVYSTVILNRSAWASSGYCNIHTCGSSPHTMCQYSESGPSSKCKDYVTEPLSAGERSALVDRHNKLRRKVADGLEKRGKPGPQPKALDMPMLVWDEELASIAQRWADQCTSGHDKCRDVDRYKVGQNIATAWSTAKITKKVENLVDDWYNEVKFFSRYYVDRYHFGMSWGHYSQVVWAKTLTVGCGRVFFWDTTRRMNTLRLVCNYGPAGNYRNEPVYVGSAHSTSMNHFVLFLVMVCYLEIRDYSPV